MHIHININKYVRVSHYLSDPKGAVQIVMDACSRAHVRPTRAPGGVGPQDRALQWGHEGPWGHRALG